MIKGSKAQRVMAELPIVAPLVQAQWATLMRPRPTEPVCAAHTAMAFACSLEPMAFTGSLRKAARGRPLRASEKRFNKLISKRRFRIEQCFGTMKHLFGLHRAGDFGVTKTHAQLALAAIGQNLLKAANKITLNPQTNEIA